MGEIQALQWGDIRFNSRFIEVSQNLHVLTEHADEKGEGTEKNSCRLFSI
jgi:hypothetical protein